MRPVIVAIIPSSLQRPLIVCCPACSVFLRVFFSFASYRIRQSSLTEQSIIRLENGEKVRNGRSCDKLYEKGGQGGAGRGTPHLFVQRCSYGRKLEKGFLHVDLLSQYGVFSVDSVSRIWISDLFSLLPLSDFQHQDQYKSPSRNRSSWNSGSININCNPLPKFPKFSFSKKHI